MPGLPAACQLVIKIHLAHHWIWFPSVQYIIRRKAEGLVWSDVCWTPVLFTYLSQSLYKCQLGEKAGKCQCSNLSLFSRARQSCKGTQRQSVCTHIHTQYERGWQTAEKTGKQQWGEWPSCLCLGINILKNCDCLKNALWNKVGLVPLSPLIIDKKTNKAADIRKKW